jgi:hypothetical protein
MNENNEKANALRALEFQRAKENDEKKTNRIKKWLDENNMRMLHSECWVKRWRTTSARTHR